MYVNVFWSVNTRVSMSGSPLEKVVHGFELTSPLVYVLFILLGWFMRWGQVAVQLLFCWVLLPRCVQNIFFSMSFMSIPVVYPYSSNDIATAGKKLYFILSEKSGFHNIDNQSITFYAFTGCMLTSLTVDKIWLPSHMNWSTNFRSLSLKVEMAPSYLKLMNSILFVFTLRTMPLAACIRVCAGILLQPVICEKC